MLDSTWEGVSIRDILPAWPARPPVPPRPGTSEQAARRTCRWRRSLDDDVLWPTRMAAGRSSPEHGGRSGCSSPSATSWKSAPSGFAASRLLLDHDVPGFWERYGYHNEGDPWREERLSVS